MKRCVISARAKAIGKLYSILTEVNFQFGHFYHSQSDWWEYETTVKAIKSRIEKLEIYDY